MPEDGEDGKVVIGPAEIYDELMKLRRQFDEFKWQIIGGTLVASAIFSSFAAYLTNYALHR